MVIYLHVNKTAPFWIGLNWHSKMASVRSGIFFQTICNNCCHDFVLILLFFRLTFILKEEEQNKYIEWKHSAKQEIRVLSWTSLCQLAIRIRNIRITSAAWNMSHRNSNPRRYLNAKKCSTLASIVLGTPWCVEAILYEQRIAQQKLNILTIVCIRNWNKQRHSLPISQYQSLQGKLESITNMIKRSTGKP